MNCPEMINRLRFNLGRTLLVAAAAVATAALLYPATVPAQQTAAVPAELSLSAMLESDWLNAESVRQLTSTSGPSGKPTPEQDAAGGCDGVVNGRWGFHTENQDNPWWQVDLKEAAALDRIVLWNRCDMPHTIARVQVLLSEDGKVFKLAYEHDGKPFSGFADKKPLTIDVKGAKARYVKLQLAGHSYFYFDEIEVYPVGGAQNIALRKPATQSSISQWSERHVAGSGAALAQAAAVAIDRGLALAESLRQKGSDLAREVQALDAVRHRLRQLPADAKEEDLRKVYFEARAAVRNVALRNPLLDFDSVLFVKAAPGRFPHMSDQCYGWWSRPGGGVFILENFKTSPRIRNLTADMPEGSYLHADLSFDGKKVLFAYCRYHEKLADLPNKADKVNVPEDAFYHVFEMNIDGTGRRQLTHGKYDDFDARYLPDGRIVFTSTRKGQFLQCTKANSMATLSATLPDSYVRCGGDEYRPVPVFTLHVMDGEGGSLRPLSAFENFEWTPALANDGRILYTRWDYIDRFNGPFFSLWSTNTDGSNPQLVYGNYTVRPQAVMEAAPVPGSNKLVFTAAAHHSITGGSLVLLDRTKGLEDQAPLKRLTPEVPFPETESNVGSYYLNPHPLSEDHYLVGWSNRPLPPHCRVDNEQSNPTNASGIYLYDSFGNLTLLYRDPDISSGNPIPVRPRPKPPVMADSVAWDESSEGAMLIQDVYQGLPGVERGSIKWIRVVGVPPKTQPRMNQPNLGVSAEDPGKFLVGLAPVEADGSAHFRVPAGVPLLFQAVDRDGLAVQTMRSLTYVWPKQTLSCVGCHESRESAPIARRASATLRAPSRLAPGPEGTWPLRYDRLVQPVLDKSCISCHAPNSGKEKAAKLNLAGGQSYANLLEFSGKDLHNLAFEKDRSVAGQTAARKSRLWTIVANPAGHEGVRLDAASLDRLGTWMDLYAQRQGCFNAEQETQLTELRKKLADMLTTPPAP